MLVAMTFSSPLFASVVIGLAIGHVIFNRHRCNSNSNKHVTFNRHRCNSSNSKQ